MQPTTMNLGTNKSVPFEIPEINHGLKQAQGLIKLWERGLEMEFEVALLGLFKNGVETIRIPYKDLNSIQYKKGWFGDKIILEGVSMKVFEEIPGTEVATCELKVKRKNRDAAQSLISQARMHLSENKLEQLDEDHSS